MTLDPDFKFIGVWRDPSPYRGALTLPVKPDGSILFQLRDDKPGIAAPGKWGLFGGGIEDGETPLEAVAREFLEETGLDYPQSAFKPAYQTLTGSPNWGLLTIFKLDLTDPISAIRTYEGTGFACCTPDQGRKLDLIGYVRTVVDDFWAA